MKGTAKAILVGGLIVAAQAAMADGSAFPSAGDDAVHVTVQNTHVDRHASDPVRRTGSAFPSAGDDTVEVTARSTYADSHLDRPALASRPAQGADTGAN